MEQFSHNYEGEKFNVYGMIFKIYILMPIQNGITKFL